MKKFFALVAVAVLVAFAAPALAANPFMDVPMNHWAYDAVSQLTSHGIIQGYPDGTFKGNQPMTRYELATLVARAMAVIDMDKASKQDVEMLKKLVVEFKDELDALGVKVDEIDSRLAVMEENLGGWKLWGEFRFDAKWEGERDQYGDEYNLTGNTEFDLNRYRLWMSKQIDENTRFVARLGGDNRNTTNPGVRWERYYIEMKLGYDINMTVGQWCFDWEDESGLYADEDAWFTDRTYKGFWLTKDWGMADVQAIIAHNEDAANTDNDYMLYGLRANFNFNEQFRMAINGLMKAYDEPNPALPFPTPNRNQDEKVYWADFAFNFNPNVAFKGAYFLENLDTPYRANEDSPNAYKAIVDVKQEAFGFTSLWLEYAKLDRGFNVWNSGNGVNNVTGNPIRGDMYAYDAFGASVLANRNWDDTTILFGYLTQKWNDKWTTFERYLQAEFDTAGIDDTTNWTFGVRYQHTPAIMFELAYDNIDWGTNTSPTANRNSDDHVIRLRTHVKF